MKNSERPVNLNLFAFHWPLAALASIVHRVTGVMLFAGMAFLLYGLSLALQSEAGLAQAKLLLTYPLGKFIAWGILTLVGYHFSAGVKHLLMDFGFAETLPGSRAAAQATIALGVLWATLAGIWVW